ncbi:hypothetical protein TNIN_429721 [Trichonephila inaurata madagascariensis]|uniref:Uncharacterized protein n=1 Tax=Trichonephila inaurata madagascariensis TaxID=2747483 RepID=A0A8X6YUE1_9ARAC|nr:hypothetical protein TNIN_429721 [Trichonephila inaurata madagascariensis]
MRDWRLIPEEPTPARLRHFHQEQLPNPDRALRSLKEGQQGGRKGKKRRLNFDHGGGAIERCDVTGFVS